jgi:ferredoxin
VELNAQLARKWPLITESRSPLPDADAWAGRDNKRALLTE